MTSLRCSILFSLLLGGKASCAGLWEWAGVYHAHEAGTLTWTFEKKGTANGQYADPTINVALRTTSTANAAGLHAVEEAAEGDLNGTLTTALPGAVLTLNTAHKLQLDSDSWITIFKFPVAAESNIAVFAQHFPTEFSDKLSSVIRNDHAEDLSPSATEECAGDGHDHGDDHDDEESSSTNRIGEVIVASLVTALPTLLGIALVATACSRQSTTFKQVLHYTNSLASGILLAAALFLFLPEAQHMLAVGKTEAEAAAAWGSTAIAGWLVGAICHLAGDVVKKKCSGDAVEPVEENSVEEKEGESPPKRMMWVLGIPVFTGDFFCNLADGFVLGTAFRACSPSFAWKICGIIIAHELPQEVADIYTLVFKAGFKWWQATLLNFVCGCAALLGAIIAYYANIPYEAEGAVLALAGGVFLYVALTELAPSVHHNLQSSWPFLTAAATIFIFMVGAASIGLILLDHEHCAAGGGHGDSHGDSHGDTHGGH